MVNVKLLKVKVKLQKLNVKILKVYVKLLKVKVKLISSIVIFRDALVKPGSIRLQFEEGGFYRIKQPAIL